MFLSTDSWIFISYYRLQLITAIIYFISQSVSYLAEFIGIGYNCLQVFTTCVTF